MRKLYFMGTIVFLVLLCGCVCSNNQQGEVSINEHQEQISPSERFFSLPDSMLTADQLSTRKNLEKIFIFHTEAKDNRMLLSVEREYFIEHGIPVELYDTMVKHYENNNKFIEQMIVNQGDSTFDLAAEIERNKGEYYRYLEDVGENGMSYHDYCKKRNEAFEKEFSKVQND